MKRRKHSLVLQNKEDSIIKPYKCKHCNKEFKLSERQVKNLPHDLYECSALEAGYVGIIEWILGAVDCLED